MVGKKELAQFLGSFGSGCLLGFALSFGTLLKMKTRFSSKLGH